MSTEYAVWQQRGLGKREAWLIVCQIVRKIFEDLQSARISARSARDRRDIDFSTASFIYATLKCHGIMADYVKHQFHDHPAVSAVITRHLASNFVKPEVSGSGEKKVAALSSKVDALEAKVQLLLKDKNPKHNKDPKNLRKKGGEEEL
jgi:glycyl-tRNA synthetase beta subunit